MALLSLLGRRWSMRVLWELRDGAVGFTALRASCDEVSPTLLSTRLRELVDAALVVRDETRSYALSPLGVELVDAMRPLLALADRWQAELGARS